MNNVAIHNVIFCEQYRQEAGGRYTLLGATAPELNIDALPHMIFPGAPRPAVQIAIFITGKPLQKGDFEFEIRVLDPSGERIIGAKVEGDFTNDGLTAVAVGPMPIAVTSSGDYKFEWSFSPNEWVKIADLRMNVDPRFASAFETIASSPPTSPPTT